MLLHQSHAISSYPPPSRLKSNELIQADVLVVPGNSPPFLGKETAHWLGVLFIGVKHLSNNTQMLGSEKLFAKCSGMSDGIGCLKNIQVTFHIDKTVPLVARKHDRTPIHMRTKVTAEIQKLEQEGIIEKSFVRPNGCPELLPHLKP